MMSFTVRTSPPGGVYFIQSPLVFKSKPRLSSKRTHLVHQQHSAPGRQCTGVGLTGERAGHTGLRQRQRRYFSQETRLSLGACLSLNRTRGVLLLFVGRGREGKLLHGQIWEYFKHWWGGGERRCRFSPTRCAAQSAYDAGDARRAGITAQQQQQQQR